MIASRFADARGDSAGAGAQRQLLLPGLLSHETARVGGTAALAASAGAGGRRRGYRLAHRVVPHPPLSSADAASDASQDDKGDHAATGGQSRGRRCRRPPRRTRARRAGVAWPPFGNLEPRGRWRGGRRQRLPRGAGAKGANVESRGASGVASGAMSGAMIEGDVGVRFACGVAGVATTGGSHAQGTNCCALSRYVGWTKTNPGVIAGTRQTMAISCAGCAAACAADSIPIAAGRRCVRFFLN